MTLLFRTIGLLLRYLPDSVFYSLASILGYLWFYVIRIRRRVALENLALAMDIRGERAKCIIRDSFIGLCASFLEFISRRDVRINYINYEECEEIIRNGAIVVTAHTANWDVLEEAAYRKGIRIGVLSRKSRFSPLQSYLEFVRRSRNEVVFDENTSLSTLIRFLRSGGVLGLVIDQNMPPRHGRPALFFNREVNTTYTPQVLSIKTGLCIIPVFIKRVSNGSYDIIFYQRHIVNGISDKDIESSMNYLNSLLEGFIREYPSQWLWVHKRFKPLRR